MLNKGIIAAAALVPLLAAGAATADSRATPLRCEIVAERSGGMTALTAVVHADRPLDGSYSFSISGKGRGGSSDIRQGGQFAAAKGATTLGQVMLNGAYDASLKVTVGGKVFSCARGV